MAKGKKTGGKDFEPGNPYHRPRLPEDLRQAKALTRMEFERLANQFLFMSADEIGRRINDPATPALELMVGSVIKQAVVSGDQVRLNFLLERLIGKVPDKSINTEIHVMSQEFKNMDRAQLIQVVEEELVQLKKEA